MICPLCGGKGYLVNPLHTHAEKLSDSDRVPYREKICPMCRGRGRVEDGR